MCGWVCSFFSLFFLESGVRLFCFQRVWDFVCFVFQGVLICYCFSESIDSSCFSFSEIFSVCFVFQETRFLILFCFPERMDFPFLVFFFRNCGFHWFWFALKRVSILHFFCFPSSVNLLFVLFLLVPILFLF